MTVIVGVNVGGVVLVAVGEGVIVGVWVGACVGVLVDVSTCATKVSAVGVGVTGITVILARPEATTYVPSRMGMPKSRISRQ